MANVDVLLLNPIIVDIVGNDTGNNADAKSDDVLQHTLTPPFAISYSGCSIIGSISHKPGRIKNRRMTMIFEIQRFTDAEGVEATAPEPATESSAEPAADDIQVKIDAAVSKATAKFEAELKKRELAAKQEAERLSKLSDDERAKAELETMRSELAAKEAILNRKEREIEMTKVLEKRGIPLKFMDFFITDDNESTLDRITSFEKEYKKAIEDGVNERLKGKTPKNSSTPSADNLAKNGFFTTILENQIKR